VLARIGLVALAADFLAVARAVIALRARPAESVCADSTRHDLSFGIGEQSGGGSCGELNGSTPSGSLVLVGQGRRSARPWRALKRSNRNVAALRGAM